MESEISIDNAKLLQNDDPSILKIQESQQPVSCLTQPIDSISQMDIIQALTPNSTPHHTQQLANLGSKPNILSLNIQEYQGQRGIKTTGTPIDNLLAPQEKLPMADSKPFDSLDSQQLVRPKSGETKSKSKKRKHQRKRQREKLQAAEDNSDQGQQQNRDQQHQQNGESSAHHQSEKLREGEKSRAEENSDLRRLHDEYVREREKKDSSDREFYCELCNASMQNKTSALKHLRHKSHRKNMREELEGKMLSRLPDLPKAQLNELQGLLVNDVYGSSDLLTENDRSVRAELLGKIEQLLNCEEGADEQIIGSLPHKLQMYGSSLHLCGFSHSDLNLNIKFTKKENGARAPQVLVYVKNRVEASGLFEKVEKNFRAKDPHLIFVDPITTVRVRLSVNCENAVKTSRLLWIYMLLDNRIEQLSVVFRSWAHRCRLDRQHDGTLAPHSFILMTIFFMQQHGLVPAIHQCMSDRDLNHAVTNLTRSKTIRMSQSQIIYHQSLNDPPNPTVVNDNSEFERACGDVSWSDDEFELPQAFDKLGRNLSSECFGHQMELAELWLQMLRFYAFDFDLESMVIDIRTTTRRTRLSQNWNQRRIGISDPFTPQRNMCKSLANQDIFNQLLHRLRHSCFYFNGGDLYNHSNNCTSSPHRQDSDDVINELCDSLMASRISTTSSSESATTLSPTSENGLFQQKDLKKQQRFKFDELTLSEGGQFPDVMCHLCKEVGHSRVNCCQDTVGLLKLKLPKRTSKLRTMLDHFLHDNFMLKRPDRSELEVRERVYHDIYEFLNSHLDYNIQLRLFGSSRNGFGFKGSDLDMCMTFVGDNGENRDPEEDVRLINLIQHILFKCHDLHRVFAITTAKVPIVKFEHRFSGLEGDISLYNTLAIHNTEMLRAYSQIDERCRLLGYAMKTLVKGCNIGDASRGSLSSYAYTLMVIFYLQQCNPPVLPVLQKIYKPNASREVIVNRCNAYYFKDIEKLSAFWDGRGKNTQSVGDLWIGLLNFYASEFDFREQVVCIRKKDPLTVFEKEWTAKTICIEDPFVLGHNLGGGISRKMSTYILRVLGRACTHFSTTPKSTVSRDLYMEHFIDCEILINDDEMPNDGCCKVCGKIGHYARDCPHRRRQPNKSGGNNNNGNNQQQNADQRNNVDRDEGSTEIRCFNCKETGHYRRNCPHPNSNSNEEDDVICFNCGQSGHVRRRCPRNNKNNGGNNGRQHHSNGGRNNGRHNQRHHETPTPNSGTPSKNTRQQQETSSSSTTPTSPKSSSAPLMQQQQKNGNGHQRSQPRSIPVPARSNMAPMPSAGINMISPSTPTSGQQQRFYHVINQSPHHPHRMSPSPRQHQRGNAHPFPPGLHHHHHHQQPGQYQLFPNGGGGGGSQNFNPAPGGSPRRSMNPHHHHHQMNGGGGSSPNRFAKFLNGGKQRNSKA